MHTALRIVLLATPLPVLASTLAATPCPVPQGGNWAVEFHDGTVEFPYHPIMNTGETVTIEGWVRNAVPQPPLHVFIAVRFKNSAEDKELVVFGDGRIGTIYAGSPWPLVATGPGVFPLDGKWHHVAFVRWADGTYKEFLDGQEVYAGGPGPCWLTCNIINSDPPTQIGRDHADGWAIDEVRISDVARYSANFQPQTTFQSDANTVLLAHFDEGSGITTWDDGVANQVGTLIGNVTWVTGVAPDTDGDGLDDQTEITLGTDPMDQDSDDDGLSDGEEVLTARTDRRWLQSPNNARWYRLTTGPTSFGAAASMAQAAGGNLATVRDAAENDWLYATFGHYSWASGMWIGLHDAVVEGSYAWTSGEPLAYTRWALGEPSAATPAEDYVILGGRATPEPGNWYDEEDHGQHPALLEAPGQPVAFLDPLAPDTDGDGIQDGTELGRTSGWPGDPTQGIGGTDPTVFVPDADPASTTDPIDLDSDEDGLSDGDEDLDGNGRQDPGETDPASADSDGDLLQDGTELGRRFVSGDTDPTVHQPDTDVATTTDPLAADSDGGGLVDGEEDLNHNGAHEPWAGETDPDDPGDDVPRLSVDPLVPGQTVPLTVSGGRSQATIHVCYSLTGAGPTQVKHGIVLDLSPPITVPLRFDLDRQGNGMTSIRVPGGAVAGMPVWIQGVEQFRDMFRVTNLVVTAVQ